MPSVTRPIVVLDGERSASSLYRVVLPARHLADDLERAGVTVVIEDNLPPLPGGGLEPSPWAGVVVLRAVGAGAVQWAGANKARGSRLAYNIDDDLLRVPEWNPSYAPRMAADIRFAVAQADFLWASTPPLVTAMTGCDPCDWGRVLPNLIDPDLWPGRDAKRSDGVVTVGWAGSVSHRGDLAVVTGGVKEFLKRFKGRAVVRFLGDIHPDTLKDCWCDGVYFDGKRVGVEDYPRWLTSHGFDLLMCPLEENPFNRSKSNIKVLESTLAGAAVVATPYGPYALVNEGNGYPVPSPDRWADVLSVAAEDALAGRHVERWRAMRDEVLGNWSWGSAGPRKAWLDAHLELAGVAP